MIKASGMSLRELRLCSLTIECVLLPQNVFSYLCSNVL